MSKMIAWKKTNPTSDDTKAFKKLDNALADTMAVLVAEVTGTAIFQKHEIRVEGAPCWPRRKFWMVETALGTLPMDISECEMTVWITDDEDGDE